MPNLARMSLLKGVFKGKQTGGKITPPPQTPSQIRVNKV